VKDRVADYFRASGKSRYADGLVLAKALLFAGLSAASYAAILLQPSGGQALLLPAFLFGVSALLLAINIGHDAAHRVLVRSRPLNDFIQAVTFGLLGVNAYLWQMRHTRSHHVFPNVNGCDIDIDENPFLRLSPNQPWRWYFRFQHLYAPLAYVCVALHTVLWQDFVYLFKRRLANMTAIRHPPHQYAVFAIAKFAYFALVLAVPMRVLDLPWWQVLLGYLAVQALVSLVFVFLLIGTHFSDVTEFPAVADDGSLGRNWAEHNLATSCDWSPHSRVAHFFVGGVNAHASHHLFPNVSHTHYRAIARIIEQTAAEFGVRYHKLSLFGIIRSHYRFLYRLGRQPGQLACVDQLPRLGLDGKADKEILGRGWSLVCVASASLWYVFDRGIGRRQRAAQRQ
jgi:linoleoyl-CoA desaturase